MALSIFDAARDAPDRLALVAGGHAFSYADLADRVRDAVAWLRRRGLDEAPRVALIATHDLGAIEMLHALLALSVPAVLVHPRLTLAERQAFLARAGDPPVLDARWRDDDSPPRAPAAPNAAGPGTGRDVDPDPPPDDGRPLAILSTSGTTGRPRAVVLSRRAFAASAAASAANLGWEDDDRWLLRLPVAHVGGLSVLTRCLLGRRAAVVTDVAETRALAATIERERITILSLVPTLLARLLDLEPRWDPPAHVRAILLGGAAASPALLARAADRAWPVLTTYGLTEACSQVTTQRYGTINRGDLGSGIPLAGTAVRISDRDEIQVRGPTLLTGYLAADGAIEDPFLEGGWFATGDHGRLDDEGNLHVFGRRADRIVTGGENVDPVEVEQALERLPDVRQACVFGVPDEQWGAVVCAAVVVRPGFDPAGLDAALRDRLASFKRPRRIARLDALPTNANGKVDRAAAARAALPRLEPL